MMRFWKIVIYCINISVNTLREQYMLPKTCGKKILSHVANAIFTGHEGIVNYFVQSYLTVQKDTDYQTLKMSRKQESKEDIEL